MPEEIPEGVSCTLCLEPDEPMSMVGVSIKRRFIEAPAILPICLGCAESIFTAMAAIRPPEDVEVSSDQTANVDSANRVDDAFDARANGRDDVDAATPAPTRRSGCSVPPSDDASGD